MILSALLNIIYVVIIALTALLPTVSVLPDGIEDAIDLVITHISKWNVVFPVFDTLFTIVTLMFTIEAAIFLFQSINWVINKLRGSG